MKISKRFKLPFLGLLITVFFACNTDELENKIAALEADKYIADLEAEQKKEAA